MFPLGHISNPYPNFKSFYQSPSYNYPYVYIMIPNILIKINCLFQIFINSAFPHSKYIIYIFSMSMNQIYLITLCLLYQQNMFNNCFEINLIIKEFILFLE